MELLRQLPAFLAAVGLISAVPGPAVALLIRRCSVGGFRAGVPVVLGLEIGLYLWIRRRLDALCGSVLVALGVRVATETH